MEVSRTIGRVRGRDPGPTLIVVGGMHGNEPAGVAAAGRVIERLAADGTAIRGELCAFAGNTRALAARRRFIERDLNRQWTAERLTQEGTDSENLELRELKQVLDEAIAAARGPVYFIDLHTTSAAGIPFAMCGDTLPHRAFADQVPLPIILGLEEQIDGVLVEYMTARGCVTLVCEGGKHDDPVSAKNLESLLWVGVAAAGLAEPAALGAWRDAYDHLERARGGLPHTIEVRDRHPVAPDDGFRMEPGFANIDRVRAGELLARDRTGELRAPWDGLVLLPLYQAQGEDGFFLGREVSALRGRVARWARGLRLDKLLPLLPGVRNAGSGHELTVGARAATLYPRSLFEVFGFRRRRAAGEHVKLTRRITPRTR